MKKQLPKIIFIILGFLITGCDKTNNDREIEGEVALYLLDSYNTNGCLCKIIDSSAIT